MISVSVSVDIPKLADGVQFYTNAFGFSKLAEPVAGVAAASWNVRALPA